MGAFYFRQLKFFILITSILSLISCTAGEAQFTQENPAGFWYGLWHGIISVIALIIHVFNQNVSVYEIHNIGGWYDFGFLLGVIIIWSGGSRACCKTVPQKQNAQEWEEIGNKVEKKVMHKLKEWAEDEEGSESFKEWDEISKKVEKKLKRKIREWAEKE